MIRACLRECRNNDNPLSSWNKHWEQQKNKELKEIARKRTAVEAEQHLADSVSEIRENIVAERAAKKGRVTRQLDSVLRIIPKTSASNNLPDVLKHVGAVFHDCEDSSFCRIVDLRTTNSAIFESVPSDIMDSYGTWLEEQWSQPVNRDITDFLETVFEPLETIDVNDWESHIAGLENAKVSHHCSALALVKKTIPNFCRAFLDPLAPLQNGQALECYILNDFIHPLFRESVFLFGNKTRWISGEVPCNFFENKNRADGVAMMPGRELPIAYFEGARPNASNRKGTNDDEKIMKNSISIMRNTVLSLVNRKCRFPSKVGTFAAQFFDGVLRLSVILLGDMTAMFESAKSQARLSRKSTIMANSAIGLSKNCPEDE
ncbi:hypothetical protein HK100_001631 [Physocladia obscura]|uniref:Uncharacterized protein n=1 Tax=Physocladia obscura TaxID=109957 RepID=A0AAD5XG12_9FUNG|nr:hypothetical protein HK100_001631 [Physocladia obscura]